MQKKTLGVDLAWSRREDIDANYTWVIAGGLILRSLYIGIIIDKNVPIHGKKKTMGKRAQEPAKTIESDLLTSFQIIQM